MKRTLLILCIALMAVSCELQYIVIRDNHNSRIEVKAEESENIKLDSIQVGRVKNL